MSAPKASGTTLFASGLPVDVDDETLKREFEKQDRTIRIKNVTIFREGVTFRSKGVAMIELDSVEDCTLEPFNV
jgi:RNA recognition motif-containing protein